MTRTGDSPTDPLEVLGNELRMSMLRELAEADRPLSFSELRKRVDVRDSGKFNYHLTRLCEYFVRQTDGRYELGHAGSRVIGAATDTHGEVVDHDGDAAASEECPVCGETDCGKLFHVHLSPPWR
jgi:hypothetical protein